MDYHFTVILCGFVVDSDFVEAADRDDCACECYSERCMTAQRIDGKAFAQFTVADRGRGVDAITRNLLFSTSTSTKRGVNRGLGLSVVAGLLAEVKGHIKYLETDGGGASFEVLIPLLIKKSDN